MINSLFYSLFRSFKRRLYFATAWYFRCWASFRLKRWRPYVVLVTGSSGKTTLLHLLESQFGDQALYSHHANSAFGVPFHILGLERTTLQRSEWISLILRAPLCIFGALPAQQIYVVETDCDRPGEGQFLATLLKPDIVSWLNVSRTHTKNFDYLVNNGSFLTIESAIAHEFGFFVAAAKNTAVVNGDESEIVAQIQRTKANIISLQKKNFEVDWQLSHSGSIFGINTQKHQLAGLLPEPTWLSLVSCQQIVGELIATGKLRDQHYDFSYRHFQLPPGRSSVFAGIKNTTIVDSSYNANLDSMAEMIRLFVQLKTAKKWMVLGDMVELGNEEKPDHQALAQVIAGVDINQLILVGPRLQKYTLPVLADLKPELKIATFENPKAALDYINTELTGGETILFKGSRFLEGIIEKLLLDPAQSSLLCRREAIWQQRRAAWGL